jgi:hypothetical protein
MIGFMYAQRLATPMADVIARHVDAWRA